MVFFNYATMQMAAKIVYYGPGLCGKTTNLHHIYTKTSPQSRGEMVSLETETDRTLFFDLLPIDVGVIGGFKTRLQLYTVPGQVFYNTTRKLVLKGVDGIVFVADSQKAAIDGDVESLHNLRENLAEIGLNLDDIPLVLQFNKRDLPNIASVDEMKKAMDPDGKFEHVEAVASGGVGVFETLKVISKLTLRTLRRRMTGDEPAKPPARVAQFRVQDNQAPPSPTRTVAATMPIPAMRSTTPVIEPPPFDEIVEEVAEEVSVADALPQVDRNIIAHAPIAEPTAPIPALAPEPEPPPAPEPEPVVAAPAPIPEPEIDFNRTEKPQKLEEKTVKVRSQVDVMAELEALRKRATASTPKPAKRDALADLAALKPKRNVQRSINVQVPADVIPRTKSVRVTLTFEDAAGVIDSQTQKLDIGDASDVQSVSVNLKIDMA
jgi:signal recognition particle receptor subunit beta